MTLTSHQFSASAQRRTRVIKICEAFPVVVVQEAGESHMAFRIRKRIFAYYLLDHHGDAPNRNPAF
jgi:hypothetical protein